VSIAKGVATSVTATRILLHGGEQLASFAFGAQPDLPPPRCSSAGATRLEETADHPGILAHVIVAIWQGDRRHGAGRYRQPGILDHVRLPRTRPLIVARRGRSQLLLADLGKSARPGGRVGAIDASPTGSWRCRDRRGWRHPCHRSQRVTGANRETGCDQCHRHPHSSPWWRAAGQLCVRRAA
jgi:hypothetical protein